MWNLLIDENAPNLNGLVADFIRGGVAAMRDFTRGDDSVPVQARTVKKSSNAQRACDDTYVAGDTIFLGIGYAPNNLALAELTTTLAAAFVTRTLTVTGGTNANQTYSIAFTAGTYAGRYGITATINTVAEFCGYAEPLMSPAELRDVFLNHSLLTTDNVSVESDGDSFIITFIGNLSGLSTPSFTVANLDLVAPKGLSGDFIINTDEMVAAFAATTANWLDLPFELTRTRDGAMVGIYNGTTRVYRSVIDPSAAIPIPISMLDAYIAARAVCYDRSQTLTAGQKLQAVTNIGLNLSASQLLGQASAGGTGLPVAITLGTGLSMSGTTLNGGAEMVSQDRFVYLDNNSAALSAAGLNAAATYDAAIIALNTLSPAIDSDNPAALIIGTGSFGDSATSPTFSDGLGVFGYGLGVSQVGLTPLTQSIAIYGSNCAFGAGAAHSFTSSVLGVGLTVEGLIEMDSGIALNGGALTLSNGAYIESGGAVTDAADDTSADGGAITVQFTSYILGIVSANGAATTGDAAAGNGGAVTLYYSSTIRGDAFTNKGGSGSGTMPSGNGGAVIVSAGSNIIAFVDVSAGANGGAGLGVGGTVSCNINSSIYYSVTGASSAIYSASIVNNVFYATTFSGALTGNATTATTLQTARIINGVSFNGSADITVTVPISTGVAGLGAGVATFLATPSGANLASALTTALPASKGGTGLTSLGTGVATALGVNTGSAGAFVLFNGALGTPSSGTATNLTGTAPGLTAANVTTNANLTGAITSVGNAASLGSFTSLQLKTALTDETGSGAAVFATSPALTTPSLGVATATSINGLSISLGNGSDADSVAIGPSALSVNSGGAGNVAIGSFALANSGSTDRSVGIGYYAGKYNTSDSHFYVNNQDRTNVSGDQTLSLIYGTFAATAAAQQLTFNVGTISATGAAATFSSVAGSGASLTALNAGNISSGTLAASRGGTGVSNTGTITLAGNLVTTGAFNTTFAQAGTTTVTLPSTSSTMARTDAGQTFTGVNVFTSPKVITGISDTNGNTLLAVTATGSAVDYLTLANAATGGGPTLSATGSDSAIPIILTPLGTAPVANVKASGATWFKTVIGTYATPTYSSDYGIVAASDQFVTGSLASDVVFKTSGGGRFLVCFASTGVGGGTQRSGACFYPSGGTVFGGFGSDPGQNNVSVTGTLAVTGIATLTGGVLGTVAGGNATTGNVGEYPSASVVQGSAVALTTAAPKTVTSIILSAGDWDITAIGSITGASTGTAFDVAVGTTTNSFTGTVLGDTRCQTPTVSLTGADATLMIPAVRVSISGSTTYYLVVQEVFTIGTPAAYGRISARRVR